MYSWIIENLPVVFCYPENLKVSIDDFGENLDAISDVDLSKTESKYRQIIELKKKC